MCPGREGRSREGAGANWYGGVNEYQSESHNFKLFCAGGNCLDFKWLLRYDIDFVALNY